MAVLRPILAWCAVAACLVGSGAAQGAAVELSLDAPASAAASGGNWSADVPVRLRLSGFTCAAATPWLVFLEARPEPDNGSVTVDWQPARLSFDVPPGTYVAQPFEDAQTSGLSARGVGAVVLALEATAVPGASGCAPPPAQATGRAKVDLVVAEGDGVAAAPPLATPSPDAVMALVAAGIVAAGLSGRRA